MKRRQLRIVHDSERLSELAADPRAPSATVPASLSGSRGRDALLERGLSAIVALAGARGGAIRLASPDGTGLRLVSAVGMPPAWLVREREVAIDCGICGSALHADGMRLEASPPACARTIGACCGESACGPVLAVPLHCAGKPIGVFNLFFGDSERVPADLTELLEPTARMLDLVLDNSLAEDERLRSCLVAERQMLASEVHDSLAQGLAYMRMRMSLLRDAIGAGEGEHALKYFHDVSEAMSEAHGRLRELISQFRHAVDQGLLQALEGTARTFEERTGVSLSIENHAGSLRLAPDQEAQAYQIVQEALANVVKHAGARNARIVIERTRDELRITVEDDGRGVLRERRIQGLGPEHFGMEIMQERAQRIGGRLQIRSTIGRGTRVRLVLPAEPRPGD